MHLSDVLTQNATGATNARDPASHRRPIRPILMHPSQNLGLRCQPIMVGQTLPSPPRREYLTRRSRHRIRLLGNTRTAWHSLGRTRPQRVLHRPDLDQHASRRVPHAAVSVAGDVVHRRKEAGAEGSAGLATADTRTNGGQMAALFFARWLGGFSAYPFAEYTRADQPIL